MQKKVPSVEVRRLVLEGWDSLEGLGLTTDTSDTWSPLIRGVERAHAPLKTSAVTAGTTPNTHTHPAPQLWTTSLLDLVRGRICSLTQQRMAP